MNNERKTILIKPEDFKIPSNSKTRKKRDPNDTPPPKLRVKSEKPKMNKTTKNQVLKYIRQQQEQKYKKLLGSHAPAAASVSTVSVPTPSLVNDFNSDFTESLKFLNTISENVKVTPNLQSTLKYRPPSIGGAHSIGPAHSISGAHSIGPAHSISGAHSIGPAHSISGAHSGINTAPPIISATPIVNGIGGANEYE
jgi:hypothetical protein